MFTNSSLEQRTGSELYLLDLAGELLRRGHEPVCYSPVLGELALELTALGVPVVDQLQDLRSVPDVIHGQHHMETLAALLYFPQVPAIGFCHGWLPWQEAPLKFPRIYGYAVVSKMGRERIVNRHGVEPERVRLIPNFFDERRFDRRRSPPPPSGPKRALAYGNYFSPECEPVRTACKEAGIELTVAGMGAMRRVGNPEQLLPRFDLVFAMGRSAIEAMACGCAVIVCGAKGVGPMVDSRNFDWLRDYNFAMRALTEPLTAARVREQIRRYDAADTALVTDRIWCEATLSRAADRIVALYEEAIRWGRERRTVNEREEVLAAAAYLRQWSPDMRKWANAAQKLQTAETLLADTREQLANRDQALEAVQSDLDEMRASLSWRLMHPLRRLLSAILPAVPERRTVSKSRLIT